MSVWGIRKDDDIDEVIIGGEGFNIQTIFPSKAKAANFSNWVDIDNVYKTKLGKKRRNFTFRNFCFRKKDAIGVDISQKALEFLDCRSPGKATTIPRKKLHGGVGGIGRPTSSAIGKTRSEIEGVHWGWVLVLANVFHLGLALRC